MKYITPEKHFDTRTVCDPSQRQIHVTPISSPLYVITTVQNPQRYYNRYKLYQAFEKHMRDSGAVLYTVELALRDRHFEVTDHNNPRHIQLRATDEMWHKENLQNIALSRLPSDWEYVAWIDADVTFVRPDWVNETLHQLQHYKVVQMFSHAFDLGPNNEPIKDFRSFMYSYVNGAPPPQRVNSKPRRIGCCCGCTPCACPPPPPDHSGPDTSGWHSGRGRIASAEWHPGYAWAIRRSALNDVGGWGDIAILGSADHHMATAFIGKVEESIHKDMQPSYKSYWKQWQERAEKSIKRNVGYVPGTLLHGWHGRKKDRRYVDRWQVLIRNKFDWMLDLKRDMQGLWQLTDRNLKLRDELKQYSKQRNEDATDVVCNP